MWRQGQKGIAKRSFKNGFYGVVEERVYTETFYGYNKIIIETVHNIEEGENMTGKEIVNLIRQLRLSGMSDTKILDLIEYIETHDPKEQKEIEE